MSLDCSEVTNWISVHSGLTKAIAWGQWGAAGYVFMRSLCQALPCIMGSGHQGIISWPIACTVVCVCVCDGCTVTPKGKQRPGRKCSWNPLTVLGTTAVSAKAVGVVQAKFHQGWLK